MLIRSQIHKLRIISFLLFFTPVLALLGSLIIHNYLVSFKFELEGKFNFEKNIPGETIKILCTEENNFCKIINSKKANKLNECNKYKLAFKHISENYPEHVPKMKKFLVIFRGINTEYYDQNNINKKERTKFFAKLNIEPGKKIILMPGRLTEWKGQELLIESLNILKNNFGYKNFDCHKSIFK